MVARSEFHNVNKTNVKNHVKNLAKAHGIKDAKTSIDFVANKFAELSGNDVYEDEIMRLSIMLARHEIISKSHAMKFIRLHLLNKK